MQLPEKLMRMAAGGVAVVLRTEGDPAAIMKLVRRGVAEIDPHEVIYNVQTMNEVVAGSLAARRLSMILLGVFAALALVLSCVGIYGVISYVVGQRTHEIGVRMALGAQSADVMRLVVGEGAKMALLGVAAGIAGAFGLTRLMANQLFGVTAHDPLTFAAVATLLTLVALLACYLPARRAVRVDPGVALRCEVASGRTAPRKAGSAAASNAAGPRQSDGVREVIRLRALLPSERPGRRGGLGNHRNRGRSQGGKREARQPNSSRACKRYSSRSLLPLRIFLTGASAARPRPSVKAPEIIRYEHLWRRPCIRHHTREYL